MNNALLEVRNLKKYFPIKKGLLSRKVSYVKAVDDISFDLHAGETFGLIGESGCGKTTVGKLILRLNNSDSGEIFFNGQDISRFSRKEMLPVRKDLQMIFQDPYGSLNPRMTVEDILKEPMLRHRTQTSQSAGPEALRLLDMVGLSAEDLKKYPHEFSGGQRQRIVIARALALRPKLIICDEPVSALDVSVQAQVLNLMDEIQKQLGVAYLFIAHGMPVIRHISRRIGVMYLGKLVEVADAETVFESAQHPYTLALMSAVPIPDPEKKKNRIVLNGEVPSPINLPGGCRFHTRCNHCMEICKTVEPEMTEVSPGHLLACHLYSQGKAQTEGK